MKRALLAAALVLAAGAAPAQSAPANSYNSVPPITVPYVYAPTLTSTPQQVLPFNPQRRRIIFINPNASAAISFCPAGPTRTGATITCAVNGAGSITIAAGQTFALDIYPAQGSLNTAWMGVASSSAAATILEFE